LDRDTEKAEYRPTGINPSQEPPVSGMAELVSRIPRPHGLDLFFLVFRLLVILGGLVWLRTEPTIHGVPAALAPTTLPILESLYRIFVLYTVVLYFPLLIFLERVGRSKTTLYLLSLVVDLVFLSLLIHYTGEIKSHFRFLYFILILLHSYFFGFRLGWLSVLGVWTADAIGVGFIGAENYVATDYLVEPFFQILAFTAAALSRSWVDRARHRAEKLHAELKSVAGITQDIMQDLEVGQIVSLETVRRVAEIFEARSCSIKVFDPETRTIRRRCIYAVGFEPEELEEDLGPEHLRIEDSLTGFVIESQQAVNYGRDEILAEKRINPEVARKYERVVGPIMHLLIIPLISGQEAIGTLELTNRIRARPSGRHNKALFLAKEKFTEEDEQLLLTFGGQLAAAIKNALSYDQVKSELRIKRLVEKVTSDLDHLDEVCQNLMDFMRSMMDSPVSTIWIYDSSSEKMALHSHHGLDIDLMKVPAVLEVRSALLGEVVDTRTVVYRPDITAEPNYQWAAIAEDIGCRQWVGIPLLSLSGDVLGAICAHPADSYSVDSQDITRLESFAEEASRPFEYAILRQRENQLDELITRLGRLEYQELSSFLDNLVVVVQGIMRADAVSLFFVDETEGSLILKATTDRTKPSRIGESIYARGEQCITRQALDKGQPAIVYDVDKNPARSPRFIEATAQPHRSLIGVPIKDSEGRSIGIIRCINKTRTENAPTDTFTAQDQGLLIFLSNVISRFIENAILVEKIRCLSKEQEEYLENMIHELITPVNVILAHTEYLIKYLQESGIPVERKLLKLRDILAECGILDEIVKGPSVIEETRADYDLEPVSIHQDVLVACVSHVRVFARPKRIEIVHRDVAGLPRFDLDKNRFYRVMYNLLLNAVKYSDEGTRIEIGVRELSSEYELHISNRGIEVPEEFASRIFEKGVRAPNAIEKAAAGRGWGLFVASQILENLHCRIELTKGHDPTVFSLFLPKDLVVRGGS